GPANGDVRVYKQNRVDGWIAKEGTGMDFSITQAQRELVERIETMCSEFCSAEQESIRDSAETFPTDLYQALADTGILAHRLPTAYGGQDGSLLDCTLIGQQLGRHSSLAVSLYFVNCVCAELIARAGTKNQKGALLPQFATGSVRFAFALTEPGAGSDAGAI